MSILQSCGYITNLLISLTRLLQCTERQLVVNTAVWSQTQWVTNVLKISWLTSEFSLLSSESLPVLLHTMLYNLTTCCCVYLTLFFMFKFPLLYNMQRNRNCALIPSFTRHLHDVHCYFLPFCFSTKSLHATWICMIIHPFGCITAKTPARILKDEGTLIWDHYRNWHMSVPAASRYLFSAHVFWILCHIWDTFIDYYFHWLQPKGHF